jgi:hypothetical protein
VALLIILLTWQCHRWFHEAYRVPAMRHGRLRTLTG